MISSDSKADERVVIICTRSKFDNFIVGSLADMCIWEGRRGRNGVFHRRLEMHLLT